MQLAQISPRRIVRRTTKYIEQAHQQPESNSSPAATGLNWTPKNDLVGRRSTIGCWPSSAAASHRSSRYASPNITGKIHFFLVCTKYFLTPRKEHVCVRTEEGSAIATTGEKKQKQKWTNEKQNVKRTKKRRKMSKKIMRKMRNFCYKTSDGKTWAKEGRMKYLWREWRGKKNNKNTAKVCTDQLTATMVCFWGRCRCCFWHHCNGEPLKATTLCLNHSASTTNNKNKNIFLGSGQSRIVFGSSWHKIKTRGNKTFCGQHYSECAVYAVPHNPILLYFVRRLFFFSLLLLVCSRNSQFQSGWANSLFDGPGIDRELAQNDCVNPVLKHTQKNNQNNRISDCRKNHFCPGCGNACLFFSRLLSPFAVYITTFLSNYQMLARLGPAVSSLPNGTRSQTRLQSGPRFTFRNGSVGQAKPQSEHQPSTNTTHTRTHTYTHTPHTTHQHHRCQWVVVVVIFTPLCQWQSNKHTYYIHGYMLADRHWCKGKLSMSTRAGRVYQYVPFIQSGHAVSGHTFFR